MSSYCRSLRMDCETTGGISKQCRGLTVLLMYQAESSSDSFSGLPENGDMGELKRLKTGCSEKRAKDGYGGKNGPENGRYPEGPKGCPVEEEVSSGRLVWGMKRGWNGVSILSYRVKIKILIIYFLLHVSGGPECSAGNCMRCFL